MLGDSLDVCGRVYVCTQAFIGFLAFELLVNNASSDTLAFSLRLVPFLPAADSPTPRQSSVQLECTSMYFLRKLQKVLSMLFDIRNCMSLGLALDCQGKGNKRTMLGIRTHKFGNLAVYFLRT